MESTAAVITLWGAVSLLLRFNAAQTGIHTVESGHGTASAGNDTNKSRITTDQSPRESRSMDTNVLKRFLCPDPLMTSGCSKCEKSCANPNPSPLCASNCDSTCICKPGLYRTFIPSPICAPPNGPLLNNCKAASRNAKG
ncbi:uncharacterized protein LOC129593038 [Paramacrobiotus metropolitanus]|uniref:uncharacterized protein LOC129593038 n=1 Tax=Paramacrobiotus metropolitanus TaxID=2943436 RepID=UPI002445F2E8|nr:uncharacterized protein LOC129593038 [Paramacrobiotus metropolitanus]